MFQHSLFHFFLFAIRISILQVRIPVVVRNHFLLVNIFHGYFAGLFVILDFTTVAIVIAIFLGNSVHGVTVH